MMDADHVGRVDDALTETTISIYVKFSEGVVHQATFRTLGCSACIASSSVMTELLIGKNSAPSAAEVEAVLGGLPEDKHYCAELVAEAARRALEAV